MNVGKINITAGAPLSVAHPAEPARRAPERPPVAPGDGKAPEDVEQAVGKLNELFLIFDKSVRFSVDDSSGDIKVKIIDNKSQSVLREYPPERVVDILRRIREAVGVLVDEKA